MSFIAAPSLNSKRHATVMAMTHSRLILGPAVLLETIVRAPGSLILLTLLTALLSDIFDGVLARRWRIVTGDLRAADSKADIVCVLAILAAVFYHSLAGLLAFWQGIVLIAGMELASTIIDLVRYGRQASFHAYNAKLQALSFYVLAVSSLCFDTVQPFLTICIAVSVLHNLEGYVIRALLPLWAHDISGIPAAMRLRPKQIEQIKRSSSV